LVLLRSESPTSKCAKLHTVAASNNRDHAPRSLYYCLFSCHIYMGVVLHAHSVRGEPHIQHNASIEVAIVFVIPREFSVTVVLKPFLWCIYSLDHILWGTCCVPSHRITWDLTLWEPAYKHIVPRFLPKTSSFRLPYQCHSSSNDCAREFKGSNPSRSSKVSKDSDCSLVSSKNLSEMLPSNGLGSGPAEVGQGDLKALHLWHRSQKIHTPQAKNFFWVQTRKLAESFEPLKSFLPLSVPELCACKATCDLVVLAQESSKVAGRHSVKKVCQTPQYLKSLPDVSKFSTFSRNFEKFAGLKKFPGRHNIEKVCWKPQYLDLYLCHFAPITCQQIELESCSNPLTMWKVF